MCTPVKIYQNMKVIAIIIILGGRGINVYITFSLLIFSSTGQRPVELMRYHVVRRPSVCKQFSRDRNSSETINDRNLILFALSLVYGLVVHLIFCLSP